VKADPSAADSRGSSPGDDSAAKAPRSNRLGVASVGQTPRLAVFCSPAGPEVFHSVIHHQEVWRPDPFDVPEIHAEARAAYQRLIDRVSGAAACGSGRILLLLGESGSGKTHLMRVFRNQTHERAEGYFSYMQMTSAGGDYGRYLLNNVIDSLDKPYFEPVGDGSALMRLSSALVEDTAAVPAKVLETLRETPMDPGQLAALVYKIADRLIKSPRFGGQDLGLIRALLYLQRQDSAVHAKVLAYLRCQDLAEWDRRELGGIVPRTQPGDPEQTLYAFARLVRAVETAAFVVCLDQLEDIHGMQDAEVKFRRAIQTVIALGEIPNTIVLISCLEDFYQLLRGHLPQTHLDRLEMDPEPLRLRSEREPAEVALLIATRLAELYGTAGIEPDPAQPLYPFPTATPSLLAGSRTRLVIDWCKRQRDRSLETRRPPIHDLDAQVARDPGPLPLEALWNDALAGDHVLPKDEPARLRLLAAAVERLQDELPGRPAIRAVANHQELLIEVPADAGPDRLYCRLCDKSAQGGHLARQIAELAWAAGDRRPVALRSSEFPRDPRSKIARQIGAMIAAGGRRVLVGDSDWRAMVAMEAFARAHARDPAFGAWLQEESPLSRSPALRQLLDLDTLKARVPRTKTAAAPGVPAPGVGPVLSRSGRPAPGAPPPRPRDKDAGALVLGVTCDPSRRQVTIAPERLLRHAAFLGGSGSGKTTAALGLIEQMLFSGVPALLVDRKGDLVRYADPAAWAVDLGDPERNAARDRLRERLEIALYTPGAEAGRPLGIAVAPPDLGSLPGNERAKLANLAAAALGGVMGYKAQGSHKQRLAILGQAIAVLSEIAPQDLGLDALIDLVDRGDPSLLSAIGRLDPKNFKQLAEDLETLRLMNGELFARGGERLDTSVLLHSGGKTRLSVISTAFLGDNANTLFWVAQLLLDLARYCAKHPAAKPQGVLLLDEADLYLPAQSLPPTKEPLEGLLRRARSAGVCLFLATQSPGDLDYRSRDQIATWLLGRIKETTAINKLKPMLARDKLDLGGRLAGQQIGEFLLVHEGEVLPIKSRLSLVEARQIPAERILALAAQTRRP